MQNRTRSLIVLISALLLSSCIARMPSNVDSAHAVKQLRSGGGSLKFLSHSYIAGTGRAGGRTFTLIGASSLDSGDKLEVLAAPGLACIDYRLLESFLEHLDRINRASTVARTPLDLKLLFVPEGLGARVTRVRSSQTHVPLVFFFPYDCSNHQQAVTDALRTTVHEYGHALAAIDALVFDGIREEELYMSELAECFHRAFLPQTTFSSTEAVSSHNRNVTESRLAYLQSLEVSDAKCSAYIVDYVPLKRDD